MQQRISPVYIKTFNYPVIKTTTTTFSILRSVVATNPCFMSGFTQNQDGIKSIKNNFLP